MWFCCLQSSCEAKLIDSSFIVKGQMLEWCPSSHVTPFERIHTVIGGLGFICLLLLIVSVE